MATSTKLTTAIVASNKAITTDIYRLRLIAPQISAGGQPGQFVMLGLEGNDPLLRRPFSLHLVTDEQVWLMYKVVGKGTALMAQLRSGQQVSLLGPLGQGFRPQGNNHCLVGGGLGIAPLLFLARELKKNSLPKTTISVLLGGRQKNELLAQEDFAKICAVTVATDDGSAGQHGFVTELLAEKTDTSLQVYSCGPEPMMRKVATLCQDKGWPCQVSLESHMACGMGACLGCAIKKGITMIDEKKYAHVCKDGPVFEAKKIWV